MMIVFWNSHLFNEPGNCNNQCTGAHLVLVIVFLNSMERDNLSWLHTWTPCGMVWGSHIMLLCSAHHAGTCLQCSTSVQC